MTAHLDRTPYHAQSLPSRAAKLEEILGSSDDEGRRILMRGATVVTMDPEVPDMACGDVLVHGDTILAVGSDLLSAAADGQAVVVDLTGMILMPGFCDSHRHCWQNQFRRLICDVDSLDTYMASTHGGIAPHYRPDDIYIGNVVSMLGALDTGVTCVLDFSHNSRSGAHSDAAFRAYDTVGIRAVHASAPPNASDWDGQWPDDVARLHRAYTRSDRLVTVRMGIDMRPRATPELLDLGREMGVAITIDGVMGRISSAEIEQLGRAGALAGDVTLIHCTDLTDDAWEMIASAGVGVTLAPTSDEQIGIADAMPPIQKALDHGIRPSLSIDVEIALSTDMFSQMRAVLATQRMGIAARRYHGEDAPPTMIRSRDVLDFATRQGAVDNGLGDWVGTLSPGKKADMIAIAAEDANNFPLNNAIGTVVLGADAGSVDTVMVGGRVKKWAGRLVGVELAGIRQAATASRDRILEEAGFTLDILADAAGFPQGSRALRGEATGTADWGPTPVLSPDIDGAEV